MTIKTTPLGGWKLKRDSINVMVVWFTDGNKRTMYSLDWKHKFSPHKDETIGWLRFYNLKKRYGIRALGMLISKNDSDKPHLRTLLKLFSRGREIPITDNVKNRIAKEFTKNVSDYQ